MDSLGFTLMLSYPKCYLKMILMETTLNLYIAKTYFKFNCSNHHMITAGPASQPKLPAWRYIFSAYVVVKFCCYKPTMNFNVYLLNRVLLFGQPLYNHHAGCSQPFKVMIFFMIIKLLTIQHVNYQLAINTTIS